DGAAALVAAAREAMVNAAKHSGDDQVDVYAEVGADGIEAFVRDRGVGFESDAVAGDRYGIRHSVIDRVSRHGGHATIKSKPGSGTEVRLWMPTTDDQESRS
ncbi:MAG: sensor histidine kinase, partial [Nocardioidaceae bacterium]